MTQRIHNRIWTPTSGHLKSHLLKMRKRHQKRQGPGRGRPVKKTKHPSQTYQDGDPILINLGRGIWWPAYVENAEAKFWNEETSMSINSSNTKQFEEGQHTEKSLPIIVSAGHSSSSADHPSSPADHPSSPADHSSSSADHSSSSTDHPSSPAGHPSSSADHSSSSTDQGSSRHDFSLEVIRPLDFDVNTVQPHVRRTAAAKDEQEFFWSKLLLKQN